MAEVGKPFTRNTTTYFIVLAKYATKTAQGNYALHGAYLPRVSLLGLW